MAEENRPLKVFVSHAGEDVGFAKKVIQLLLDIGIPSERITCTSIDGYRVKVGRDWSNELKRCFQDYRCYVIIVHSSHFYKSAVCLNEMGAAWALDCPIFSFLVNGFNEGAMAGVLTSNHQAAPIGRGDVAAYIDQLREELKDYKNTDLSDDEWSRIRDQFLQAVSQLPIDKGTVKTDFDINLSVHVTLCGDDLFGSSTKDEINVSWADILKAIAPALRSPHTEYAIRDALSSKWSGIAEEDKDGIIDSLHHFGLADTYVVNTEYEGCSSAWVFTEAGRNAYERACNYHLQAEYRERDRSQLKELLLNFSTNAMDEYLREGPEYVSDILLQSSDAWYYITSASAYRIHDPNLYRLLRDFYQAFCEQTMHGEVYEPVNGNKYRIYNSELGPVNADNQKTINRLFASMSGIRAKYNALIDYIKKSFPDFDLRETSMYFEQEFYK